MAGYLIGEVEVTDPEGYREYQQRSTAIATSYGGRYLVRGGAVDSVEGSIGPARLVVLEFPNIDQIKRCLASAEYQAIVEIRHRCARTRHLSIVDGVA